jgi:hypothetical protein
MSSPQGHLKELKSSGPFPQEFLNALASDLRE